MNNKIHLTKIIALTVLIFITLSAKAQYIIDDFNDGDITADPAWLNTSPAFNVSNSSPLEGAYSLRGNTGNVPSYIYLQYGSGTTLNTREYSWGLVYRDNGSANPSTPGVTIDAGENAWRFWIAGNQADPVTAKGYFIAHEGGAIKLMKKDNGSSPATMLSYNISRNQTYTIRVTRSVSNQWKLFVDTGNGTAVTQRGSTINDATYFNSGSNDIYMALQATNQTTGTHPNRFQFDMMGLPAPPQITVNQVFEGVLNGRLTEEQTNLAIMGFSVKATGSVKISQFNIQADNTQLGNIFSSYRLFVSTDSSYATTGDNTQLVTGNGNSGVIQFNPNYTITDKTVYFFCVVNTPTQFGGSPPASITFSLNQNNITMANSEAIVPFSFSTPAYPIVSKVYYWKGANGGSWNTASNWKPSRNNKTDQDELVFNTGTTLNIVGVDNDNNGNGIGRLELNNNTTINLTGTLSNAAKSIKIKGKDGHDLLIEEGSHLNISSGTGVITLEMMTGATAEIYGQLSLGGNASHQFKSSGAGTIRFKDGSVFNGNTGLTASSTPFGTGAAGGVIFEAGSVLNDKTGANYFSASNVVKFETGSTYRLSANVFPQINGKVLADFDVNTGTGAFSQNLSGTSQLTMDNLSMTTAAAGALNFTSTANVNINGNITSNSGTISFNPASPANVNFSGTGEQVISGNGGLTFSTNANIIVANTSVLSLQKNLSFNRYITLNGKIKLNASTLTMGSSVINSGELVAAPGVFVGSGKAKMVINGTNEFGTLHFEQATAADRTLCNLTINRTGINGSVTLGNTLEIHTDVPAMNGSGKVTMTDGTLYSNGNLVLASEATGTATIGSLANGDIIGNVTAQRFIPGGPNKRRWRLLSSPVNVSDSTSFTQIQDNIFVTGIGAGFDEAPVQPSLKTYDERKPGATNDGWVFPSSISDQVGKGEGVCVFVRGSRQLADPFNTNTVPDDVVIDYIGTVNKGDIQPNVYYTAAGSTSVSSRGWNLVGNPYQAYLTWDNIQKTNLENKIYFYNPVTATYDIYDATLGTGTNYATKRIAPGQGFFVRTKNTGASIRFKETSKSDTISNVFYRNAGVENLLSIRVYIDSINYDETIIALNDTAQKAATDEPDASKFFNDYVNIYSKSEEGNNLAINYYPVPASDDTIKLSVFAYDNGLKWIGDHELQFAGMNSFSKYFEVYLLDTYLQTTVDLRTFDRYAFSITSDDASVGNNRFRIIFRNTNTGIKKEEKESFFLVYPNPFSQVLNIALAAELSGKDAEVSIYDATGKMEYHETFYTPSGTIRLSTEQLKPGLHYIRIHSDGRQASFKTVKAE